LDSTADSDRRLFRETTARFLEKALDHDQLRARADDPLAFDSEVWRNGAGLGWTAMLVPEAHGGGSVTGDGLLDLVDIAEELGRVLYAGPFVGTNVVAAAITESGSEELQARYLPGIASGELPAAWCLTEPSGSPDPVDVALVARATDDGYELHGTKAFVPYGHAAGVHLVTARDHDSDGLTQFVVPADAPGIECRPMACIDLASRLSEVRFDHVDVPASAVLGVAGAAADAVRRQCELAMVLVCAESLGGLSYVNEVTFEYANDRFAFGRPIASFQAIKHYCVEMYLGGIGSRGVTEAAALAVHQRAPDAEVLARAAKAYVGEAFSSSAEHSHQIYGGISVTWEHDAHLYMRRAKFNEAIFGSPSWQRDVLGRTLGI
jgi:alkylation response protein AidB-like acyl-CoA dehydrogenase